MPYISEWVPNELFLEHNGVQIFRTYRYDEGEARRFSFGTASDTTDEYDDTNFSVLDLPTFTVSQKDADETVIKTAIKLAIDHGLLQIYIDAAKNRPNDVDVDEAGSNHEPIDLGSFSTDELRSLLLRMESTILTRIELKYRRLDGKVNELIRFGEDTVDYADGAEYSITGLVLRHESKGEALMVVQDEDGGPRNVEQYIEFIEITVLIDILYELERMAKI
jgi:hypothetical protein